MDRNRIWVIAGVFVILLVAGLGWLLGVKPQLDVAQAADEERAAVDAQNLVHAEDLAALKEQYANLDEYTSELASLRESLPASADLQSLLGELNALEGANGVKITGYSALDATPFVPSAEIVDVVPASVSASNFVSIPVEVTVDGPSANVFAFIKGLQSGGRLYLVSDLSFTNNEDAPGTVSATISGLVYVLLDQPIAAATDPAAVVPADGVTDATGE
jgi:Tfp pilus assembly protein PilO